MSAPSGHTCGATVTPPPSFLCPTPCPRPPLLPLLRWRTPCEEESLGSGPLGPWMCPSNVPLCISTALPLVLPVTCLGPWVGTPLPRGAQSWEFIYLLPPSPMGRGATAYRGGLDGRWGRPGKGTWVCEEGSSSLALGRSLPPLMLGRPCWLQPQSFTWAGVASGNSRTSSHPDPGSVPGVEVAGSQKPFLVPCNRAWPTMSF